jgi:hypothetical protein
MFVSLFIFVALSAFWMCLWLASLDRRKDLPTITSLPRARVSGVPAKWRRDKW